MVTDDINGCTGCSKNNATWFTPSIYSGGYQLPGTTLNSYLNLGTFPYLVSSAAFTLSVWVAPDFNQTSANWGYVFSNNNAQLFYLAQLSDWRFLLRTTAGTYRVDTQNLSWTEDTWHMLTVTYNGSLLNIYWDGFLSSSVPATGLVYPTTSQTFLGRSTVMTGGSYQNFDGNVDELRIYNYALSGLEVINLFLGL
ncbi:hypothetical protein A2154_00925 [Candidatus Gottesmanbacteria bacterium RBG_16_43_7]|uniref:LamG-like jellyroll fold domain-containing protein n=1 Tax=Candidatus Gottesmanbacteria bacterium RBG_16_43_7 TaxID=1798373 RepID=A0A1F5Z924_9BACT|nr:MAG: hypothetical protein A2154_00925 [Candidatus Gottesmanbacteria bacterium RBG_16_43_7]